MANLFATYCDPIDFSPKADWLDYQDLFQPSAQPLVPTLHAYIEKNIQPPVRERVINCGTCNIPESRLLTEADGIDIERTQRIIYGETFRLMRHIEIESRLGIIRRDFHQLMRDS